MTLTLRVALALTAIIGLVSCTSHHEPELPSTSDTAAIAGRITGPDGQTFLREITTAAWDDDGRRAAELFEWVPRDAASTDPAVATRAGQTAHAVGAFLADNRNELTSAPANPALWQSYSKSLTPYIGAMVGDPTGTRGFEQLDEINSDLSRTASLFATMTKDAQANRAFIDAAAALAHTLESAFAKAAVADPVRPATDDAVEGLMRAAYLRALVDTGRYLADPKSPRPTPRLAQTELKYQIVSLTARPTDPHINSEFFKNGRLLSLQDIAKTDWSIYDNQLSTYLVAYPQIRAMVNEFGHRYDLVAT
jgi:hypothetical protein